MRLSVLIGAALLPLILAASVTAHPLGNFSINQFTRIEVRPGVVRLHHVVDMAEIPTLQETPAIDANADGVLDRDELDAYAKRTSSMVGPALSVVSDGQPVALHVVGAVASTAPGAGGLNTLRIECDYEGATDSAAAAVRSVQFHNMYLAERLGWREIVVVPAGGVTVFDASITGNSASDELRAYPDGALAAPLAEVSGQFSYTLGAAPSGSTPLALRDGQPLVVARDRLAELIAVPTVTPWVALIGLLVAAGLGGFHALSPGHGKTIVGAYLVGARGTPWHAVLLGLTVTITHTAGVFALGLVTLFASQYVVPERLYPVLGVVSGAIVLAMGVSMFATRLRGLAGVQVDVHSHSDLEGHMHTHGGTAHSHLPPGADGSPVTVRSLVALGISGGLLPCPSALVVLLAAISLHRVAYGLLLVVAFSVGLAGVLTAIGFVFVYAGRKVKQLGPVSRLFRVVPIASAAAIAIIGGLICYGALGQAGIDVSAVVAQFLAEAESPSFQGMGALGVLGLGLLFGLKHATEADHIVAVTTIVSEHRKLTHGAIVGALWGVGHTASLVVVGTVVLALRIAIPEAVASWLEFGVAVMIIGLGAMAMVRGIRGRGAVHVHKHEHDGRAHAHVHFHEDESESHIRGSAHSHTVSRIGFKPLLVGAMHGLAGSAALTLLVLTQISSAGLGLLYLVVFGIGSIGGMLAMSGLVGVPFALTSGRLSRMHHVLQIAAGLFSLLFGFWYAYVSGIVVLGHVGASS